MKKKFENGEWKDSLSIKLTFEAPELPKKVSVEHSIYAVRPYNQQPLQCYKCQRIGHTASSCRARMRCLRCGDNHNHKDCPISNENIIYKCVV